MGKHVRIALALALLACACGRKPPRPEPLAMPAAAKSHVVDTSKRYEADGSLKGSGKRVEWLELPAGFEPIAKLDQGAIEIFEAELMPFDKACDFLSRRMFTGKVDRGHSHAVYPAVMPLDMNESAPRLNVSLSEEQDKVRLTIVRIPRPAPVTPLSDDEARKILAQEAERVH